MKGFGDLQWAAIVLILMLILLFFIISPTERQIDAKTKNSARIIALDIASSLNLIQTSPPTTEYVVRLPNIQCEIEIHRNFVRVSTGGAAKTHADADVLEILDIPDSKYSCSGRKLTIIRSGNIITISGAVSQ